MPDTDELAAQEALLRKSLEAQEARWVAQKIGLAIARYPRIMREAFLFLHKPLTEPLIEEIADLKKRVDELETAMGKAREAYAELKRNGVRK